MSTTLMNRPTATSHARRVAPTHQAPGSGKAATPPRKAAEEASGGSMASVSKALLLLESLTDAGNAAGVSALARATGMPKSTAFRLLSHLEDSGLVERSGKEYQLGWRLFEMGNNVEQCRPDGIRTTAVPHLTDLHARTGMTAHLAILEGADVVYLDKVHGLRTPALNTSIAGHAPASCTSLGKAMMAFLPPEQLRSIVEKGLGARTRFSLQQPGVLLNQLREARRVGHAYDREESRLGTSGVAAPILRDGFPVAAVSIEAPTRPVSAETHASLVRDTAAAISAQLGTD